MMLELYETYFTEANCLLCTFCDGTVQILAVPKEELVAEDKVRGDFFCEYSFVVLDFVSCANIAYLEIKKLN